MEPGIQLAASQPVQNPMPINWLGLPGMPVAAPQWSLINVLSLVQMRRLLAQIGYSASAWDYKKINNNRIGRYQFSAQVLEAYGLLQAGSYAAYGDDSVNYSHCWNPAFNAGNGTNFQNYYYNTTDLESFLNSKQAQDYLAYQRLVDLYYTAKNIDVIKEDDTTDVIAGMMYVCWSLSVGSKPTAENSSGTGGYAWRYHNVGYGTISYNAGRYAINVLSVS